MDYFSNCECVEDLKKEYKRLCLKFHPDVCDLPNATELMQEINSQYELAFKRLKNTFKNKDGNIYENTRENDETPEDFINILNKLVGLEGIQVELLGRWIWVTGNTKQHKDLLKSLGFRWCVKKMAWSWHRVNERSFSRGDFSLDEIREKYASKSYNTTSKKARLTA